MVKCTDFKCSMNFDKYIHLLIKISITAKNEVTTSCLFAVSCCHPRPQSTTDLLPVKTDEFCLF